MRYAILSDIHANLEALSAALDHLAGERIDTYLCAGDTVGYGADPSACLARLQQLNAVCVAGNHEWGCIGKLDLQWFTDAARQALEWTRDQLSFTDLEILRRMPLTMEAGPCTLVHGTLRRPERFEYLTDLAQAVEMAMRQRTMFGICGHTHAPCLIEYDAGHRKLGRILMDEADVRDVRLSPEPGLRYVINPGSVGQPRDGDPRASVAILDAEAQTLSIRRVPYPVAAAQRKIREAGLPEFLAERLALGR